MIPPSPRRSSVRRCRSTRGSTIATATRPAPIVAWGSEAYRCTRRNSSRRKSSPKTLVASGPQDASTEAFAGRWPLGRRVAFARRSESGGSFSTHVVDVPPLARGVDLAPSVAGTDLIDYPAHLRRSHIHGGAQLVRGGSRRVGRRSLAREIQAVEVGLLIVGAIRTEGTARIEVDAIEAKGLLAHRVPGRRRSRGEIERTRGGGDRGQVRRQSGPGS